MATTKEHVDSRACVITAAKKLFTERSFDAVSMNDIAEACGLQKASLYYFFPSKEAIYAAIMADVVERTLVAMRYEFTRANRTLTGDAPTGRREMARLIAKFIRVALKEGTVVRQIDIAFMKSNADYRRMNTAISRMHDALLAFFMKHNVADPSMALELTINAIRAYILNKRVGCGSHVSPSRYAGYLAGLLIK